MEHFDITYQYIGTNLKTAVMGQKHAVW